MLRCAGIQGQGVLTGKVSYLMQGQDEGLHSGHVDHHNGQSVDDP